MCLFSGLLASHNDPMDPTVTVVIPVRNEPQAIRGAIESIIDQTYSNIIEILVADGMSTDGTRAVIAAFDDPRIRIIDNVGTTTPAGLNAAIEIATGDIIVRCDAHSVLPPDYVAVAQQVMAETGAVNVGGIQRAIGTTFVQQAVALAMSSRLGVGDAKFHYGGEPGPTDTVYLGVFNRQALVEAGSFDETLIRNQDYELNIRLRRNGGLVFFDPRLAVEYQPRSTLAALAKQYFQYGAWKRIVHRRHPEAIRLRQLAAPLLVIGLAVSIGLAFTPWRILSLVVPAAYATALIGATLVTAATHRRTPALLMPIAIIVMHLSWGVGYLSGLKPGTPPTSA